MTQAETEVRENIESILKDPPNQPRSALVAQLINLHNTSLANELIDEYDLTKLYGIEPVRT